MTMKSWMVGLGLAILSACSSEMQVSVTCDIQTTSVNTCTVSQVGQSKSANLQQTCKQASGKVSFDPCTRVGYFGICTVSGEELDSMVWSFPSSTVQSQSGAQTACVNIGGTFSVNTSF